MTPEEIKDRIREETKDRIKEIRSRIRQDPLNEHVEADFVEVSPQQKVSPTENPVANKIDPPLSDRLSTDFVKGEDFIKFQDKLNEDVKSYLNILEETTSNALLSFEAKIPDIKKGSRFRDELFYEIDDRFENKLNINLEKLILENQQRIDDLRIELNDKTETAKIFFEDNLQILRKDIEVSFKTNLSKVNELEEITNGSIITSFKTVESIKKDLEKQLEDTLTKLEEFDGSIREDINSSVEKFTLSNQETEIKLQNSFQMVLHLESSIEKFQKSFADGFDRRQEANDKSIKLLTTDLDARLVELFLSFTNKSTALEETFVQNIEKTSNEMGLVEERVDNKIAGVRASLEKSILSSSLSREQKIQALSQDINAFKEKFGTNVREVRSLFFKQKTSIDTYLLDYKTEIDKRTQGQAEQTNDDFRAIKQQIIENEEKLKDEFDNQIDICNNNLQDLKKYHEITSSELKSSIKDNETNAANLVSEEHFQVRRLVSTEIEKLTSEILNLSSSTEEIKSIISAENLELFNNLKDDIDLLGETLTENSNLLSEERFEVRKLILEEVTNLKNELSNLTISTEEKNLSLITDFNSQVSAITGSLGKTRENYQDQVEEIKSIIFKESLDLFNDLKENIEDLRTKIGENRDNLSCEFKDLLEECSEIITQKTEMSEVESFFNQEIEKRIKTLSGGLGERFKTLSQNIQLVKSMVVREEDLTKLFKNYSLNVNFVGSKTPQKLKKTNFGFGYESKNFGDNFFTKIFRKKSIK